MRKAGCCVPAACSRAPCPSARRATSGETRGRTFVNSDYGHSSMDMELPAPYVARPHRGPAHHPAMASILSEYHQHCGSTEVVTASQLDATYANLVNCDTATDVMLIEVEGET